MLAWKLLLRLIRVWPLRRGVLLHARQHNADTFRIQMSRGALLSGRVLQSSGADPSFPSGHKRLGIESLKALHTQAHPRARVYSPVNGVGRTLQPCRPGTYSEGNRGVCTPCPLGWACPEAGLDVPKLLCPAGHACIEGTIFPVPCPPGTLAASQGSSSCELCSGESSLSTISLRCASAATNNGTACSMSE